MYNHQPSPNWPAKHVAEGKNVTDLLDLISNFRMRSEFLTLFGYYITQLAIP
jgi:hypothetical protein